MKRLCMRRGSALLLAAVLGAVLAGGCLAAPQADADSLRQQLSTLSERWGRAYCDRDGQPLYALMTRQKAAAFYQVQQEKLAQNDPDGSLSAAQRAKALWNIGVSSPWANEATVVSVDPDRLQVTLVYNWHATHAPDYRTAEQLTFVRENGALKVAAYGGAYLSDTALPVGDVSSMTQFEQLYANDLGLPDTRFLYDGYANDDTARFDFDPTDPRQAAVWLLHLTGGTFSSEKPYMAGDKQAGQTLTYRFQDGSTVCLTMLNLYDLAYLPMNWTRADGSNSRTASDLARQWARGIASKSGQFLYPILSSTQQQAFIYRQQQLAGEGETWYWKVGGSSPSFQDFAVTNPSGTPRIVYLAYGGGVHDYRSLDTGFVQDVMVGTENRRAVITRTVLVDAATLTGRARFQLLFGTGLPLPSYPAELLRTHDTSADIPWDALKTPETAAATLFGLNNTAVFSVTAQSDTAATMSCVFRDQSGTVQIRMERVEGTDCWLADSWRNAAD